MNTVYDHYKKLAATIGNSIDMSMKDLNTKNLEIDKLLKYLKLYAQPNSNILEIGCGNGYTADHISKKLGVYIKGIDFCRELIDYAVKRNTTCVFVEGNALDLPYEDGCVDIVYTERCLINLIEPGQQEKALDEIYRVLKEGGIYVMIECFTDGLENINAARKSVRLNTILQPDHNKYFHKPTFLNYIRDKFKIINTDQNFLSSYYWGSRVLYPAILNGADPEYNSKFVEFFTYMEPLGNYSYIQCYVLEKKKKRSEVT